MDICIKKAAIEDIDRIVDNRMDFLNQVTVKQQTEEFREVTKEYLINHLGRDSLLCYIATHNEHIVSSVIVCIYNVIPKPSNITGKVGYLFNVYTLKDFRRQGLATKLIENVITEAKQLNIGELYLNATDDGKLIYEKLHFLHIDKEMCLDLI